MCTPGSPFPPLRSSAKTRGAACWPLCKGSEVFYCIDDKWNYTLLLICWFVRRGFGNRTKSGEFWRTTRLGYLVSSVTLVFSQIIRSSIDSRLLKWRYLNLVQHSTESGNSSGPSIRIRGKCGVSSASISSGTTHSYPTSMDTVDNKILKLYYKTIQRISISL
jgi:hypothetical protein